jgi:hypothetical protein
MVWAKCTGDYEADIDAVLTRMVVLYGPMTQMMGPPREDSNSEGPAIDIYLVTKMVDSVRRSSQDFQLSSLAATIPIQVQGTKSSGFMLLDRERVGDPDFALDMAHEFFHVLQSAHNFAVGLGTTTDPTTGQAQTTTYWWDEATAEWAAAHFVRERSASIHQNNFVGWFQRTDLPLHAVTPSLHPYAAYGSVHAARSGAAGQVAYSNASSSVLRNCWALIGVREVIMPARHSYSLQQAEQPPPRDLHQCQHDEQEQRQRYAIAQRLADAVAADVAGAEQDQHVVERQNVVDGCGCVYQQRRHDRIVPG